MDVCMIEHGCRDRKDLVAIWTHGSCMYGCRPVGTLGTKAGRGAEREACFFVISGRSQNMLMHHNDCGVLQCNLTPGGIWLDKQIQLLTSARNTWILTTGCMHTLLHVCIYVSMYLSVFLFPNLSIFLPIYLSICLSIYRSIYLAIYLPIYPSIYRPIYLSFVLSFFLSFFSFFLSIYLSVDLSICLSTYL